MLWKSLTLVGPLSFLSLLTVGNGW